jgi:hypothetical protein
MNQNLPQDSAFYAGIEVGVQLLETTFEDLVANPGKEIKLPIYDNMKDTGKKVIVKYGERGNWSTALGWEQVCDGNDFGASIIGFNLTISEEARQQLERDLLYCARCNPYFDVHVFIKQNKRFQ